VNTDANDLLSALEAFSLNEYKNDKISTKTYIVTSCIKSALSTSIKAVKMFIITIKEQKKIVVK